jgi:hypothetical protein
MKKILFCLSLLAFTGSMAMFTSCDKLKEQVEKALNFDLVFQTAGTSFTIPEQSTTGTYTDTKSETFDMNQFIKDKTDNQLSVDNIRTAKIKSCKLTLTDADADNNFQNFSKAKVILKVAGQPDITMEISDNPDTYATELSLPVDATKDLVPYLKATTFTYEVSGTLRKITTKDLTMNVKFEFDVNVGKSGE